ncbi:MAG: PIG-L family deacetylase [Bacteroidota bacterium]
MPRLFLALFLATLALPARAQLQATDEPKPLVVMNLAAHPDDEDGLMLAYARGHLDAVAYSVIYTRGEGGQNEAGPDLYERLGAIRSRETEAAGRTLGTQVFFLNHYDFGFSKHADETFAEWSAPQQGFWEPRRARLDVQAGRDALTAQVVYLYRKLKPDVVFTNHDTVTVGARRQHGHHQAVGISGYDAFALAADPTYHPEQLEEPGVDLWQPSRFFLRKGGFSSEAPEVYDVAVPVIDTCVGTAYRPEEPCAERAVAAAGLHVSQGFDKFAPRFYRETTYYELLREADGAPPLPTGATNLAHGLERDAPPSVTTRHLIDSGRIRPLETIEAEQQQAVPGDRLSVRWTERGEGTITFVVAGQETLVPLAQGETEIVIPTTASWTQPLHRAMYGDLTTAHPITYCVTRPSPTGPRLIAAGDLSLDLAPPVMVDLAPDPTRLRVGPNAVAVSVEIEDASTAEADLYAAVHWDGRVRSMISLPYASVDTTLRAGEHTLVLDMIPESPEGRYALGVEVSSGPVDVGPPPFVAVRRAVVLPEVRVADGLRVGHVRSYDGTMADALAEMGAEVVELDSLALAAGTFEGLHTIVIDIRAYLDRKDLRAHNTRLLDWVREGGHLVVSYQKLFEWNAGRPHPLWADDTNPAEGFAPYPLQLGRQRVTMQDAPVTVAMPDHPLFHFPHAITEADWDGWVQERGLYFPTDDADARYARPLAMSDAGEDPLTTGLLLADVGEGTYLYSPLVWYRQLDALNAGSWRLFANLVSLPLAERAAEALEGGGTP